VLYLRYLDESFEFLFTQFTVMKQIYVFVTSNHLVGFIFIICCLRPCSTYCSYVTCHLISVRLGSFIIITFVYIFIHVSFEQNENIIMKSEFISN